VTGRASYPDYLFVNGHVATQDPQNPTAEAVAVARGRILALGATERMRLLAGPETDLVDLEGRLVLPGFIDTHIHFCEWALKRQGIALDDLTCLEDLLERVGQAASQRPSGQWIMGQGWNETEWAAPLMPTRQTLDRAAPDHPVVLWRCDLHLVAVNSIALQQAGIDGHTPDPQDGRIEHDTDGEPTGILRELAINLVRRAIAPPDTETAMQAFRETVGALHRRGVTAIHDVRLMADKDGVLALQTFQELERQGDLDLRTWVTLPGHHLDEIIALGLCTGFGNDRLRIGHVKFFSDGGMGARTAWMIEPYLDADCGMPLMDMKALSEAVSRADAAGLSVMVHAVGDRANRELVELFEALENRRGQQSVPPPPISHRIEHVQMIRPVDAMRLGRTKTALSVTPFNMILDMNLIDRVIGNGGPWTYAFRLLMDSGAPVMFSSDCPVCDPDPLLGIHAAVTRQRADGTPQGGWHPQNRITVAEAIQAYTATPAAVHQAHDLGVIAVGNRADLVVLSKDILAMPPSEMPGVRVDMTLFDGRMVYRR
jgi:predicted amidohydrolase YtcJ